MISLDELQEDRLSEYGGKYIVFFHTPLCGTCKVARRMLGIVQATMDEIPIYSYNANQAGAIVQNWKIQSVPALAYVENGQLVDVQFAFRGVDELYRRIQLFLQTDADS